MPAKRREGSSSGICWRWHGPTDQVLAVSEDGDSNNVAAADPQACGCPGAQMPEGSSCLAAVQAVPGGKARVACPLAELRQTLGRGLLLHGSAAGGAGGRRHGARAARLLLPEMGRQARSRRAASAKGGLPRHEGLPQLMLAVRHRPHTLQTCSARAASAQVQHRAMFCGSARGSTGSRWHVHTSTMLLSSVASELRE